MKPSPQPHSTPRRATVAGVLGVLGAVVLAGGTGLAYAASTDVTETGYLTVVDERSPAAATAATDDCPADTDPAESSPAESSPAGSGATGGAL